MAAVETALVSANGRLLIELDDGTIIDAGYVRGSQGPAGKDGADGAPGIPGAKGDPGTNGAQWHTGVGAPEVSLGVNGDLYMDVAASVLPIYQKVNGDWMFLANLKGGGGGGGVGATGGGAAGDGSAIIIKPGPTPPTNDNDGNAVDKGDLWWDSTTGLIYIYTNNGWIAISDHPPVIVSPNPPRYTNNSDANDPNKRYPIRVGDLWMDSDQGALYVAMKDSDGDMVWVISTPANRDVLQTEISASFVIPASAVDGDTFYNTVTATWYVYNQPKKQWIDLPPGERELSYPGVLLEADPAIDASFQGNGDGNVYINNPDHEPTTRLVVRRTDVKGFDWDDILSEIAVGDGISLVQQLLVDPDAEIYETQRVDYLVGGITANSESYSFAVVYDKENLDRDPLFGEPVSVRFLAQVQSPASDFVIPFVNTYRLVNPDDFTGEDGTAALETDAYAGGADSYLSPAVQIARFASVDLNGKNHEHTATGKSFELSSTEVADEYSRPYIYGKFKVTKHLSHTEYSVDYDNSRAFRFVEGDTIYYRPSFTDDIFYQEDPPSVSRNPDLTEGDIWVDSDDNKMYVWNGSVWSEVTACTGVESGGDFVKKKGGDSMEGPLEITGDRDANAQGIESTLKVYNVDSGRNGDLQLKRNGQTKIWCSTNGITVQGQLKMNVEASKLKSSTNTDLLTFNKNGIFYEGAYSAEKHIATKANVDELSNQIIELEEEIDAIAPAVERGSWEFTLSGTISGPGKLTAYDEYVATSGNATGLVTNIQSLWFHSIDNAGTPHGFDNVEAGNLLELFVEGSPEYGLFTVKEVHDYTAGGGNYWVIDVDFVRTLEQTTRFDNGEVCRLKIFSPPEGGTADGFVLKTGDTMSGNLAIEKDGEASLTLSGKQQGTGNPVSALRFNSRNDTSLQYDGYLTYSSSGTSDDGYFKFNRKIYFTYKNLLDVGHIQMGNNKAIKENTATRIKLNNKVEIPRVGDSKEGFTIYGRNNTQLLRVYHEASGTADAVTYSGRQTSNNDLATVKYVKDAVSSGGGFVPDYDWNQNTHSVYSGSELTRKSEYPKVDGDWSIADTDNNYMANFASLDKVGRIGVQPPWGGASSYKAGYAGQIHFGPDTYNTSRPIAIFTVTTQERSGSYFQWYVRLLWCKPGLTVADLDGKSMMPCQGAVYRI